MKTENRFENSNSSSCTQKLSNAELLSRLEFLAKSERRAIFLVLLHINEVDQRQLYFELGFESLYQYLHVHLKYSEDAAYDRMKAARILDRAPQAAKTLESSLENGELKLSQLKHLEKSFQAAENAGEKISQRQVAEILNVIKNKTLHETHGILAEELCQPVKKSPRVRPQRDGSVRMEFSVSAEQFEFFKKLKSFSSHVIPRGDWGDVFEYVGRDFARKFEVKNAAKPKAKPKTGTTQAKVNEKNYNGESDNNKNNNATAKEENISDGQNAPGNSGKILKARQPIPVNVRRAHLERAGNRCEHVDKSTGHRCESSFQLQIDHIFPVAWGGENEPQNLRVLCAAHNRHVASKLGILRF